MAPEFPLTILHISDLHFSSTLSTTEADSQDLALGGLLKELAEIEDHWKPSIVCVTGDITDKGAKDGFSLAKKWLSTLSDTIDVGLERFLICPGNHDGIRDTRICPMNPPIEAKDADEQLQIPIPPYLEKRFDDYVTFCKELKLEPYKCGSEESYLVGTRVIDGFSFVACNSAWYAYKSQENKTLWLGLNILKHLENNTQLPGPNTSVSEGVSIALMHHGTEEYFSDHETKNRGTNRPAALAYLWERCHMALYGHTHENAIVDPDQMRGQCWRINSGATYAGATHPNNVNLIRLAQSGFELRTLEYKPDSAGNSWTQHASARHYSWASPQIQNDGVPETVASADYGTIKSKVKIYAEHVIESKSRQIKPVGALPLPIDLKVEVKPSNVHPDSPRRGVSGNQEEKKLILPIDLAVNQSKQTILLGDLGAGKSTLLARLVNKMCDASYAVLPLFVPAKLLKVDLDDSVDDLLSAVSDFVTKEISPSRPFSIVEILEHGWDVSLFIDGLDEIETTKAHYLLSLLTRLPQLWSGISVTVSARPAEVSDINLSSWQLLKINPLSQKQKGDLLNNEALSQGATHDEAVQIASRGLSRLDNIPPLNAIANSPLSVRLIYPFLISSDPIKDISLGDLLHSLLIQRLGEWAKKDLKHSVVSNFEKYVPTTNAKAFALGAIAYRVLCGEQIDFDKAKSLLRDQHSQYEIPIQEVIAEEALVYFTDAGLISNDGEIGFPYQPLAEISAGVFIENNLRTNSNFSSPPDHLWRALSFASGIAHKSGTLDRCRIWLESYVKGLISSPEWIVPACYIVEESRDEQLAKGLIEALPELGFRPLWFMEGERTLSIRAIAKTIILAGTVGFDWLYEEYLDPRTPPTNTGSALIQNLFKEWAPLAKSTLTKDQKAKLEKLVPLLHAVNSLGTFGFLKTLAQIVPDAFTKEELLWQCVESYSSYPDEKWSKELIMKHYHEKDKELVNAMLLKKIRGAASLLWMELNSKTRPTYGVAEGLLVMRWSNSDSKASTIEYLEKCKSIVGEKIWKRFLRWSLSNSDNGIAASAALELYSSGDNNYIQHIQALTRVLDTGSLGDTAEQIILEIINKPQCSPIQWVPALFSYDRSLRMGSSAGSWRLLLSELNDGLEGGPEYLLQHLRMLGRFHLSRNPEIRHGFRTLLSGEQSEEYYSVLSDALNHYLPKVRNAAAMILLIAQPSSEAQALVATISYTCQSRMNDWDEWHDTLLTLNYAPSTLTTLYGSLKLLSERARPLVYALLQRNDYLLSDDEKKYLIIKGTKWPHSRLNVPELNECYAASSYAKQALLEALKSDNGNEKEIAQSLLRYHSSGMSIEQRASVFAITVCRASSDEWDYTSHLGWLWNDIELVDKLKSLEEGQSCKRLQNLIKSIELNQEWYSLLWGTFCSSDTPSLREADDSGLRLLYFGRKEEGVREVIGREVMGILNDSRVEDLTRSHRHWLYVLADEFATIPPERLETALVGRQDYNGSATYSLLGRLGSIPEGFIAREDSFSVPKDLSLSPSSEKSCEEIEKQLVRCSHEAGEIEPNTAQTISSYIWNCDYSQSQLKGLLEDSDFGSLILGTLEACDSQVIDQNYAISFMKSWQPKNQKQNESFKRLRAMTRAAYQQDLLVDTSCKGQYLDELWKRIVNENDSIQLYEFLRLKNPISYSEFEVACQVFLDSHGPIDLNGQIAGFLADQLINLLNDNNTEKLVALFTYHVDQLDQRPWDSEDLEAKNSVVFLFIALGLWLTSNDVSKKSVFVFARGVKFLFTRNRFHERTYSFEPLYDLQPLIDAIPENLFDKAFSELSSNPEPDVRLWAKLFRSFSK